MSARWGLADVNDTLYIQYTQYTQYTQHIQYIQYIQYCSGCCWVFFAFSEKLTVVWRWCPIWGGRSGRWTWSWRSSALSSTLSTPQRRRLLYWWSPHLIKVGVVLQSGPRLCVTTLRKTVVRRMRDRTVKRGKTLQLVRKLERFQLKKVMKICRDRKTISREESNNWREWVCVL